MNRYSLVYSRWGLRYFFTFLFRSRSRDSIIHEFHVESHDKEKALAYYNNISTHYDQKVSLGILRWFREREKEDILSIANFQSSAKTLIDIGSGGGFYSFAAKKAGLHVKSVDAATGMVEMLRGKVDEVQVGDIETLQVDRQFDRVLCLGVLDFVLNPEQAIRTLCKLVAPGGRLILFVPRSNWAGWIYRLEKKHFGIKVNLFDLEWIQAHAEREGLSLKAVKFPLPTNMVIAFDRPNLV